MGVRSTPHYRYALDVIFLFIGSSYAISLPIVRRSNVHSTTVSINPHYNGSLGWTNIDDGVYAATIYVQGHEFQVQIDSGSSDLWLDTAGVTFDGLIATGVNATVQYVDTSLAEGPIVLANVSLGEFTVEGQAFINAPGSNASYAGIDNGLLGVGPPHASRVLERLQKANSSYDGYPFLRNVFNLNPEEPNFITFLLSRSDMPRTQGGVMTIGELVANYSSVVQTPKLPVVSEDFWVTFMDGVYVNGEYYTGNSYGDTSMLTVQPTKNQTVIVLDTGTAFAMAPRYYVDAMYKNLPGAAWNATLSTYTLPCTTKVNISMAFGSHVYPMNPIDATEMTVNSDGSFFCQGAFSTSVDGHVVDFILGDSFLRNVYMLLDYGGNFTGRGTQAPYMQILSTTDAEEAWADFDWANIQRLMEAEITEATNLTSVEAATATYTYPLVTPTWPASSSAKTSAPSLSSEKTSASSLSSTKTSASASTSDVSHAVIGGDLAENVASSPSASSNPLQHDVEGLKHDSYIIMGLLVITLILLIVVLAKLFISTRNNRYKQVPNMIPPAQFGKPYEAESEAFTTPYDDMARPLP